MPSLEQQIVNLTRRVALWEAAARQIDAEFRRYRQGVSMATNPCCFIPDDQQEAARNDRPYTGCQNEAEWEIWSGPSTDDSTVACTDHVGRMLTDAPEHRIYPLAEGGRAACG